MWLESCSWVPQSLLLSPCSLLTGCMQGLKLALAQWQGGEGPARIISLQDENRQLRDALERASHQVGLHSSDRGMSTLIAWSSICALLFG